MKVTRKFKFSACHYLSNPEWPDEKNRQFFGKSARMHGHNFTIFVTIEGDVNPKTGMVINLENLKNMVSPIIEELDHRCLNELPYFKRKIPTLENIAIFIFERVEEQLDGVRLYSIRAEINDEIAVEFNGRNTIKRLMFKFSSSHRLPSEKVKNHNVYGKCGEERHGHDYYFEIWFRGDEEIARVEISKIVNIFDHNDLDSISALEYSTGEYILQFLWQKIKKIDGIFPVKMVLKETENNIFEIP